MLLVYLVINQLEGLLTPYLLRCAHLACEKSVSVKGKGCLFLIPSLSLKDPIIDDGTEGCGLLLFNCFHLQNMHHGLFDDGPSVAGHGHPVGNRHVQMCEKIACSQSFLHS